MRRLATFSTVLLLGAHAWAAPAFDFRRVELKLEGRINHAIHRDLDGDGVAEILLMARQGTDEKPVRRLGIWKGLGDAPRPEPTQLLTLPDSAVVVDACDVTPAPGMELLLLTADGLSVWPHLANGLYAEFPTPLIEIPGVMGFPDEEDAPFYSLCRNPRGASSAVEVWVPTGHGMMVLIPDGETLKVDVQVQLRPRAYHQSGDEFRGPRARRDFAVLTLLVMPKLLSLDADKDGDDDLYEVVEDTVMLFLRTDGHLQPSPVVQRNFNTRSATDRARRNAVMDVMLGDFNGDGLPDALTTKLTGGVTSLKTETRIFTGQGARGFSSDALALRKSDGYATPLGLVDVDHDGRVEALEPLIKTSPFAVTGMLVKQRVDVDVRTLRVDANGLREGGVLSVPFALDTGTGGIKGGLPLLGQDVDGDGRADLVNLGTGERVDVLRGVSRDPPFDEDPMWSGKAPSTLRGEWYVPWPQGPASVLLFFPDVKTHWGKALLLFNTRTVTGPARAQP